MKLVYQAIGAALVLATICATLCNASNVTSTPQNNRTPWSFTYSYRIELNVTQAFPSIGSAIHVLENETLTAVEMLVDKDEDDPLFLLVDLNTPTQSSCPQGSSDFCTMAESTAEISLRANVDDRLVEFAAVKEVQSVFKLFNNRHHNVTVSFIGPFVVRTDVSILLEGVNDRMTTVEIQVFERAFLRIFSPPLLNVEPSVTMRSATVFLQQIKNDYGDRRRLQEGNNETVVVGIHVTGQCNQCSNNDFARIVGEAVDVRRRDFERTLRDEGQASGTGYFDDSTARIATKKDSPGISECCLEFYPPPDPFPFWVLIVTAACIVIFTTALCCAAFRSKREHDKQLEARLEARKKKHGLARTKTEDASEDGAPATASSRKEMQAKRRASSLTF